MKKIINGALYNTDTAKLLGEWCSNYNPSDFSFCEEKLYRTKSGKYFLYGSGGPMSKYSRSIGDNNWSGGEHIEPMSPAAAREWAEEHLSADEYSEIFGEPDEAGDYREALSISVPAETKRKLEKMRENTGKSISQIIEEMVDEK